MLRKRKSQLAEAKECPRCKITTTNFSPKGKMCRACRSKSRTRKELDGFNKRKIGYDVPFNEGIYKIIDNRDGRIVYIGETNALSRRWYFHMSGVNCGNNKSLFLGRPIKEEEKKLFKFVPWIEETNKQQRVELEKELISRHDPILNIKGRRKA